MGDPIWKSTLDLLIAHPHFLMQTTVSGFYQHLLHLVALIGAKNDPPPIDKSHSLVAHANKRGQPIR